MSILPNGFQYAWTGKTITGDPRGIIVGEPAGSTCTPATMSVSNIVVTTPSSRGRKSGPAASRR